MSSVDLRKANLRIVSLIPSATEIVATLGYADCLVGRSHECDFPPSVKVLPVCTEPKFDPTGSSLQIHERVSELLASALSVYRVKTEVLSQLRPTHIITQAQCEVCAVSLPEVEQAVNALVEKTMGSKAEACPIEIVSLQPECSADVWDDMLSVAQAIEGSTAASVAKAQALVKGFKDRLAVLDRGMGEARPSVACIEWTEPLMAAGNWVPELVSLAGGRACFGKAGAHSDWISWEALIAADPQIIVVMPCGYDLAQTRRATEEMSDRPEWSELSAVKAGQVYIVDGNQYFNRPGPRLIDSGEILAEIIQQRSAGEYIGAGIADITEGYVTEGCITSRRREAAGWEMF